MTTSIKSEQAEQQVDFKKGDLVCNRNGSLVLIVTAEDTDMFQGVIIHTPEIGHLGSYVKSALKSYYKPFKGEITLKSI